MPVITLPDGSQKHFDRPVSVAEVAQSIGSGLAKAALAGKVNGKLLDTSALIDRDAALSIVTDKDPDGLEIIRHSTAHLLANAVQELFPDAQVTIGPVIENGFYYDFAYKRPFSSEDLSAIETRMAEIAAKDLPVHRREAQSRARRLAASANVFATKLPRNFHAERHRTPEHRRNGASARAHSKERQGAAPDGAASDARCPCAGL